MFKLKYVMAALVLFLISCNDDIAIPSEAVVYYNSFEQLTDTTGWNNLGNIQIVSGAAPNGGGYSLSIKSNVDQPASGVDFTTSVKNDKFKVALWGKLQDTLTNAFIKLEAMPGDTATASSFEIKGSGWKEYITNSTFLVPENGKFRFSIYTNAKENAGLNIDRVTLIRVSN
ncbi:MAG: hypothetical protein ACEPO8_01300 [Rhodothermaceae bacterium]